MMEGIKQAVRDRAKQSMGPFRSQLGEMLEEVTERTLTICAREYPGNDNQPKDDKQE